MSTVLLIHVKTTADKITNWVLENWVDILSPEWVCLSLANYQSKFF